MAIAERNIPNNKHHVSIVLLGASAFIIALHGFLAVVIHFRPDTFWLELFRWVQFLILGAGLGSVLLRLHRSIGRAFLFVYAGSYFLLIMYEIVTSSKLDYAFFIHNTGSLPLLVRAYWLLLAVVIIMGAATAGSFEVLTRRWLPLRAGIVCAVIGLAAVFLPARLTSGPVYFLRSAFRHDAVISDYEAVYTRLVEQSAGRRDGVHRLTPADLVPPELEHIIILHLESVNGFLVSEQVTPNLYAIGQRGVRFENFTGNSVQTMLAYENILCGLPTSFERRVVSNRQAGGAVCLPELLQRLGFRTEFFKGGVGLEANGTNQFARQLGFDERHNADIMQPDDPKYPWGYREDVFYQRVFEQLMAQPPPSRSLTYIDVGATNHWPFRTPSGFEDSVPFKNPESAQQRLANTMFLQDAYLGEAWAGVQKLYPQGNFTLLVLGDHSWPIGQHDENTFNKNGGYEENFRDALVWVRGDQLDQGGRVVAERVSEMDILPTFAELLGAASFETPYARSLAELLVGAAPTPDTGGKNILEIQPFGDQFINLIQPDGKKYSYDGEIGKVNLFDLIVDPFERSPRVVATDRAAARRLMEQLLSEK